MNSVDNKYIKFYAIILHNTKKFTSDEKFLNELKNFEVVIKNNYINNEICNKMINYCNQYKKNVKDLQFKDQIDIIICFIELIYEYKRCYGN